MIREEGKIIQDPSPWCSGTQTGYRTRLKNSVFATCHSLDVVLVNDTKLSENTGIPNRSFKARINNGLSTMHPIKAVVPRISVLSPHLYATHTASKLDLELLL
ncbi:hypothetical protein MTP99_013085 [Tenebrio molitor]|nr:hypothetical protein MTP99_013085 [Tenebrio molitor]